MKLSLLKSTCLNKSGNEIGLNALILCCSVQFFNKKYFKLNIINHFENSCISLLFCIFIASLPGTLIIPFIWYNCNRNIVHYYRNNAILLNCASLTSTTDLSVHLGESKHNYVINQTALCEWAAGAGSPGPASKIYFST